MASVASPSSIVRSLPLTHGDIAVGEVVPAGAFFEIYLDGSLIGRDFGQENAVARLDAAMAEKAAERKILETMQDALFQDHRVPSLQPNCSDGLNEGVAKVPAAAIQADDDRMGEGASSMLKRPPRRIRIDAFRANA